jgi:L-asparaginase II
VLLGQYRSWFFAWSAIALLLAIELLRQQQRRLRARTDAEGVIIIGAWQDGLVLAGAAHQGSMLANRSRSLRIKPEQARCSDDR